MINMVQGNLKEAQIQKENLENSQRNDAKLRKNYEKLIQQQDKSAQKKKK